MDSHQNNIILIYDLAKLGIPQIGEITQGVNGPTGLAIDASGTLYVSDWNAGNVTIYPAGSTSPSMTISGGLTIPNGIAVDTNGDLYVGDVGSSPNIQVYAQGQTSPYRTITSSLITNPGQLFFDASRNLYLEDSNTGILEIPHGAQQPVPLRLQGFSALVGSVVLDPLSGNMFVGGTHNGSEDVLVFHQSGTKAFRKPQTHAWADFMTFGAVRGAEYLFVPDSSSNTVSIFKHDSNKLSGIFTTVQYARGVAYKAAKVP